MKWQREWMRDSSVLITSTLMGAVATGVLAVIIARHLGPRSLGVFANFYGIAQALGILIDFGLGAWLIRGLTARQADQPWGDHEDLLVSRAFSVSAALGSTMLVASALGAVLAGAPFATTIVLLALVGYTMLVAVAVVLENVFRAERRVSTVAKATVLEKGALLASVGAIAAAGGSLEAIAAGYVVAGVLRMAFDLSVLRTTPLRRPRLAGISEMRRTIVEVAPFTLSIGLVVIVTRLDIVVVGAVSALQAGYFAIGDRVIGLFLLLPVISSVALYPHLAGLAEKKRQVWQIGAVLSALVGSAAAVAIATASDWVPGIFGEAFRGAVPAVQVMVAAAPVVGLGTLLTTSLNTDHREREVARWTTLTMIPGSVLPAIGVLTGGATGAALGYLLRATIFTSVIVVLHSRGKARAARPRPL